jgi:hypothetical protein
MACMESEVLTETYLVNFITHVYEQDSKKLSLSKLKDDSIHVTKFSYTLSHNLL